MDAGIGADDGFLYKVIDGLITVVGTIMGVILNSAHKKLDVQSEDIMKLRQEHNDFKTTVAKDYVPNTVLNRIDDKLEYIIKELIDIKRGK